MRNGRRGTADGDARPESVTVDVRTVTAPVRPTASERITLAFVRSGAAVLLGGFGERRVERGGVVMLGAHALCGWEPDTAVEVVTVALDRDYVLDQLYWQHRPWVDGRDEAHDILDAVYVRPARVLSLDEETAGRVFPLLEELADLSGREPSPAAFYRAQALLFTVLDLVRPFVGAATFASPERRRRSRRTDPPAGHLASLRAEARRAAALLREDPAGPWTLDGLAHRVHLSPSQLGRVFAEAFGCGPMAYLATVRTERMAHLLRTTDDPVVVVARRAGWSDPDHARRVFRRSLGVTPTRYRAGGRR
ncbi:MULTISPECIES: helix-turn-helix transcriptional regulator [unclassified Nocardiopsis]|uniref:helix-turn-helix transcriptional regulator n=1 Tax=Nocardiopsis TaxID=2013 RepID=UPI00387B8F4E